MQISKIRKAKMYLNYKKKNILITKIKDCKREIKLINKIKFC